MSSSSLSAPPAHDLDPSAPAPDHAGEVLVRVENVGKVFCRDFKKSLLYGLKDSAQDLLSGKRAAESGERELRPGEFWANREINFELRRGDCLGLIGHNGAGKTTLLRMLNGLIKPDVGRIEMRGRIGALIALGAGFNPLLTGRENIYVNGSILGLTLNELDSKIDEIIEFSEIHDFIDSPVQTYSSGMQVKLGFAIATTIKPDVLILDEVLAVGDAAFRAKCFRRISEIKKESAVIFVSHNMEQITRICNQAILMSEGKVILRGKVSESVSKYDAILQSEGSPDDSASSLSSEVIRILIDPVELVIEVGEDCNLIIHLDTASSIDNVRFRVVIFTYGEELVAASEPNYDEGLINLKKGKNEIKYRMPRIPVKPGYYYLNLHVIDGDGDFKVLLRKAVKLNVKGFNGGSSSCCQIIGELENS